MERSRLEKTTFKVESSIEFYISNSISIIIIFNIFYSIKDLNIFYNISIENSTFDACIAWWKCVRESKSFQPP